MRLESAQRDTQAAGSSDPSALSNTAERLRALLGFPAMALQVMPTAPRFAPLDDPIDGFESQYDSGFGQARDGDSEENWSDFELRRELNIPPAPLDRAVERSPWLDPYAPGRGANEPAASEGSKAGVPNSLGDPAFMDSEHAPGASAIPEIAPTSATSSVNIPTRPLANAQPEQEIIKRQKNSEATAGSMRDPRAHESNLDPAPETLAESPTAHAASGAREHEGTARGMGGFSHPDPILSGDPARHPSDALRATKYAPGEFVPKGEGDKGSLRDGFMVTATHESMASPFAQADVIPNELDEGQEANAPGAISERAVRIEASLPSVSGTPIGIDREDHSAAIPRTQPDLGHRPDAAIEIPASARERLEPLSATSGALVQPKAGQQATARESIHNCGSAARFESADLTIPGRTNGLAVRSPSVSGKPTQADSPDHSASIPTAPANLDPLPDAAIETRETRAPARERAERLSATSADAVLTMAGQPTAPHESKLNPRPAIGQSAAIPKANSGGSTIDEHSSLSHAAANKLVPSVTADPGPTGMHRAEIEFPGSDRSETSDRPSNAITDEIIELRRALAELSRRLDEQRRRHEEKSRSPSLPPQIEQTQPRSPKIRASGAARAYWERSYLNRLLRWSVR